MRQQGVISDIKRYAVNDGPGIRTTVFFKGCPLQCGWCHNPECMTPEKNLMFFEYRCIGCGQCRERCPENAISGEGIDRYIDHHRCSFCGICMRVCPSGALEMVGRRLSPQELLVQLEKDILFYDSSGGGITCSGGEPLYQPEFLAALLRLCRARELHTVLDTSGHAATDSLLGIMDHVDLFYYDLKLVEDREHKKYTGVSNELILENLEMLCRQGRGHQVIIRLALIPGITDREVNITGIINLLRDLKGPREIQLLPYHDVREKYRRLGWSLDLGDLKPEDMAPLAGIRARLEKAGLRVTGLQSGG